jgi:regulator of nucleoside diphosphate kinase
MDTTTIKTETTSSIILTTGMFDLLKDQIRRKKLSNINEANLIEQLKNAKQVLRKDLPDNVVDINRKVRLADVETGETYTYSFVAPEKAKPKHQTASILSPIGLALIGYAEGTELSWEMDNGIRQYRIEEVTSL